MTEELDLISLVKQAKMGDMAAWLHDDPMSNGDAGGELQTVPHTWLHAFTVCDDSWFDAIRLLQLKRLRRITCIHCIKPHPSPPTQPKP